MSSISITVRTTGISSRAPGIASASLAARAGAFAWVFGSVRASLDGPGGADFRRATVGFANPRGHGWVERLGRPTRVVMAAD